MKKYTAKVTEDGNNVSYEIDGWGQSPQEFHKIVLLEHIKKSEEILYIFNQDGKRVFNLKRGFTGT